VKALVRYSGVVKVKKSKEELHDELLDEKYNEINAEIEKELLEEMDEKNARVERGEPETDEPPKKAWESKILFFAIVIGLVLTVFRVIGRSTGFIMPFFM